MSEINLLETTDATIWAQEFQRIKIEQGWSLFDIDESLMVTWFANAMCAQMDSKQRIETKQAANGSDYVVQTTQEDG